MEHQCPSTATPRVATGLRRHLGRRRRDVGVKPMTRLMDGGVRSTEGARRLGIDCADAYRMLFAGKLEGAPAETASSTSTRRPSTRTLSDTASAWWPSLLPDLLPDRPTQMLSTAHRPRRRLRESPGQRHRTARSGTGRQGDPLAHNPKVAGSNPAPATEKPWSGRVLARASSRVAWLLPGGIR